MENIVKSRHYLAIFAALMLALPASAQDYSQMSDETLLREQERLLSFGYSNDPGKGYDERITSSDYEVEFQMQQMDKAREREHQARYNMIEDELLHRGQMRGLAQQKRELEERQANADANHNAIMAYIAEQNRQVAESKSRHQAWMRQQNEARAEQARQAIEQSARQAEQFYLRSRTPRATSPWVTPAPPPDNTNRYPLRAQFPPLQPPPASEPSFPVLQPNSNTGYFSDWPE